MESTDKSPETSLSSILHNVLDNPNYLVGMEPQGSDWDFSEWEKMDFTTAVPDTWVRAQKFFRIFTIGNEALSIRIIETDPYQTKLKNDEFAVSFILYPPFEDSFPTVIVAQDRTSKDVILTNEYSMDIESVLRDYFSNIKRNQVIQNSNANEWALFLKHVLVSKQIVPASYMLPDNQVREELDISSNIELTNKERLAAELQVTEQEVLSLLYADYTL